MSEKRAYYTITKTGENQYRFTYWVDQFDSVPVYKNEMTLSKIDADGTISTRTIQLKVPTMLSASTNDSSQVSTFKKIGIPMNVSSSNLSTGGMCFEAESFLDTRGAAYMTLTEEEYNELYPPMA